MQDPFFDLSGYVSRTGIRETSLTVSVIWEGIIGRESDSTTYHVDLETTYDMGHGFQTMQRFVIERKHLPELIKTLQDAESQICDKEKESNS